MLGIPSHILDAVTELPAKFDRLNDTLDEILVTLKQINDDQFNTKGLYRG